MLFNGFANAAAILSGINTQCDFCMKPNMEIGSKVAFINENLKGVVTRFIDQKMVAVEVEDGFEIPVLKSELVWLDQPSQTVAKLNSHANKRASGFYFNLTHQSGPYYQPAVELYGDDKAQFAVHLKRGELWLGQAHGSIQPGTSIPLPLLNTSDASGTIEYMVNWMLWLEKTDLQPTACVASVKIRASDLRHIIDSDQPFERKLESVVWHASPKPTPAEVLPILEAKDPDEKAWHAQLERPSEIIDLHLDQLENGIHVKEKDPELALMIQLTAFENAFEKAIALQYEKLTVIHGVGSGELKFRIRRIISGHKYVKSFRDAQKEKFGYGATEIFFK